MISYPRPYQPIGLEWNVTTVLSTFGNLVPAPKRSSFSFAEEKTNESFYCFLQAALFRMVHLPKRMERFDTHTHKTLHISIGCAGNVGFLADWRRLNVGMPTQRWCRHCVQLGTEVTLHACNKDEQFEMLEAYGSMQGVVSDLPTSSPRKLAWTSPWQSLAWLGDVDTSSTWIVDFWQCSHLEAGVGTQLDWSLWGVQLWLLVAFDYPMYFEHPSKIVGFYVAFRSSEGTDCIDAQLVMTNLLGH